MTKNVQAQLKWICQYTNKIDYASIDACPHPTYGFLCKHCGKWTYENHKTIEKHPRVPNPCELKEEKINIKKFPESVYKVVWWDAKDKPHDYYIKARTHEDIIGQCNGMRFQKYIVFDKKGKHILTDGELTNV